MTFINHPAKSVRIYRKLLWRKCKLGVRNSLRYLGYSEVYFVRSLKKSKKREVKRKNEILTRDAIYEHGKQLAEEHPVRISGRGSRLLYGRFRYNCKVLSLAHSKLEEAARGQEALTPGAEWLLDNYHLVLQQIFAIKKHFPRGYDRTLPKLSAGRFEGYPRVYDIALELLQKTDAVVNVDLLTSFIRGYQSHAALTMGEIWAVPIMIRFALIENLSGIVLRLAEAREERKSANLLINEIIGDETKTGTQILNALTNYITQKPELLFRGSSHLITRLREMGRKAYLALQWLEERIREEGLDPEELHRNEQYLLAADQVSIGNTFSSLRSVNLIDWKEWFENVALVENILRQDPSDYYRRSDFKTRDSYRHIIEYLAKHSGKPETEIAKKVLEFAEQKRAGVVEANEKNKVIVDKRGHVGYYLVDKGLPDFEKFISYSPTSLVQVQRKLRSSAFLLYSSGTILLTCIILINLITHLTKLNLGYIPATLICLLFIVPASDLATSLIQWLVTHLVRPDFLSKLDFSKGIPDECKTAVVVQALFNDKNAVKKSVEGLEIRFLANNYKNAVFGILADLPDADAIEMPNDPELMEYSKKLIAELTERHNKDVFFVLFRKRQWNESQSKFMGWERKRGKIDEFNRLVLKKGETSFIINEHEKEILDGVVYAITLDNDSQLPNGTMHKLVGTIAHPLNIPVLSEDHSLSKLRVTEGYSIIQPRVGVSLMSSVSSRFARLFSGHAGLDPYTQTVSEVYQDLFRQGSFVGKGIYSVEAFYEAMEDRVPENSILSHDLFEGSFSNVALATDIELYEDFSSKYHVHARRQHRWVRGDWQLLPWTMAFNPDAHRKLYRSALTNLARWKLLDNLRRSLLAPCLFLYFILVLSLLGNTSHYLLILGLLVVAFPVYANVAQAFLIPPRGLSLEGHVKGLGRNIILNSKQALFTLCFIPHQAALMISAIVITLYRLIFSHKNLLEWETAFHSERRLSQNLSSYLKEMSGGILLTLLGLVFVVASPQSSLITTASIFLFWVLSPFLAKYLSDPIADKTYEITEPERQYLTEIAFHTWRYFREHMTLENNYLVPDNIQLVPNKVVVDRTSITNISLSLLTVVSAYDFGFSSLNKGMQLLSDVYATMMKLERFHGHFFNWYNIRNCSSLTPRYISMVDSGNMLGYLICLRTIFDRYDTYEIISRNHIAHARYLAGKMGQDTGKVLLALDNPDRNIINIYKQIQAIRELSQSSSDSRLKSEMQDLADADVFLTWFQEFKNISELLKGAALKPEILREIEETLDRMNFTVSSLKIIYSKLGEFLVYLKTEKFASSIETIITSHISEFSKSLDSSKAALAAFIDKVGTMREDNAKLVDEMDFKFLFDSDRDLFPIGYDADNARRDQSFYDLLASEARLGSFAAIATGQIPQQHWFSLGRPLTDASGGKVLLSWSGTMFEYLMPLVVLKDFPGTILSESYRAAVKTQILYGAKRGVPWGISESGYSGVDFERTYQYYAFGVPGLGLKRELETDLVISPYSTFMALPFAYNDGLDNLHALEKEQARGEYGFYEAIDYTPTRLQDNEVRHVVQSHLAHHQGIVVTSLNNLLNGNIMQERFHEDLQVRATELLLHEKFPDRIPVIMPHSEQDFSIQRVEQEEESVTTQILSSPHTVLPVTHLLSNGHLSLMIDNAGSGYSVIDRDISLTRWKEDAAINNYGTYVFVRDLEKKKLWSTTYQPTCVEPEQYDVIFGPDKAEFKRKDNDIFIHTEITISPEDNAEIRKITFTNLSNQRRKLDITSYGEVNMNSPRADNAHPAFSKMFIESEHIGDLDCLLFSRRPRSKKESRMYFLHMLTMRTVWGKIHFETSRPDFMGRANTIKNPAALEFEARLSGTSGYILDPIFSLRTKLELDPGQTETVTFINSTSRDKEQILAVANRYKQMHQIARAFEMAWSQSSVELRNEKIAARQAQTFQKLANLLMFNQDKFRAKAELITQNRLAQPALWRFGISGDLPIVLLRITEPDQIKIVHELLAAHHYLRIRGMVFDLVIANEFPGGYLQNFQEELEFIIRSSFSGYLMDKSGGVFLRTTSQISQQERELLQVVAKAIFRGSKGSLASQLKFDDFLEIKYNKRNKRVPAKSSGKLRIDHKESEFFNGVGGFVDGGDTYRLYIEDGKFPPLPWSNVIANAGFGTLMTESGAGYTWSDNSRENRLSTWSNDPVNDPLAEVLYVRDVDTSKYWSLTPRPVVSDANYIVDHSHARSTYKTEIEGIESKLEVSVSEKGKIKYWQVEFKNTDKKAKELELFLYVEWVLGVARDETSRYTFSTFDSKSKVLYAQNFYNVDFPGRLVALGSSLDIKSFTTQRLDFIGRNGNLGEPFALLAEDVQPGVSINLNKKLSTGTDSCGVIKVNLKLAANESKKMVFYMTEAPNVEELREIASNFSENKPSSFNSNPLHGMYKELNSAIKVKTPDRAFDILLNSWLLYQALACRLYARTGFYQSGGALGFRDQLQDVMAMAHSRPDITRNQIILHASRQFPEGDVQHWWHPPSGKGVRTKISDDFLWLPYVTCRYLDVTNDYSVLDERAGFVLAPVLGEHEHETYIVPQIAGHNASIYEHCLLAIERGNTAGVHGLPLMGAGDWNDGMNEVGIEHKGESVWLAWFYIDVLNLFTKITEYKKDHEKTKVFQERVKKLTESIEAHAWDGDWYRRAYFDDGTPLGSSMNDECRIDSISQSWGIISGAGNKERTVKAMEQVFERLVKKDDRIICLLQPAFNDGSLKPGYIKGYLPGIRENGGQYTHAAAWTVIAEAMLGKGTLATELFGMVNPITHTKDYAGVNKYKGEPYVLCGDVYSVYPHGGRAGWSWYTGSAGWMYKAGTEYILGLKLFADYFTLKPCIPASWKEYSIELNFKGTKFNITVENPSGIESGDIEISVNDERISGKNVLFEKYKGIKEVSVRVKLIP